MRLAQEHSVAVLVRTAELLRLLLVDLQVLGQLLLGREHLVAPLGEERRGGGGEGEGEGEGEGRSTFMYLVRYYFPPTHTNYFFCVRYDPAQR